jgi:hypothetical protein
LEKPVNSHESVIDTVSSESKVGEDFVSSIQLDYAIKLSGAFVKMNCSILDDFIGNFTVKRFSDMSSSNGYSTSIVVGWYDSVSEGIDMWHIDPPICNEPRL